MGQVQIRTFTVEEVLADRQIFAKLLDPNAFMGPCDDRWFNLVAKNPHQKPDDVAMVLAMDDDTIVGRLGFYAAQVRLGGEIYRTYWTDGFFLDPEYKTSGAGAMILLRSISACKSICAAGGPDEAAQKLYKASGFKFLGSMRRFAYFYRAKVITATMFGDKPYGALVGLFLPFALRAFYALKPRGKSSLEFRPVKRYSSDIDQVLDCQSENAMVRSSDSLNWILDHRQAWPFEVRMDGKIVGHLILKKYHHRGGGRRNVPAVDVGCILDYYLAPSAQGRKGDLVRFGIEYFKDKAVDLFEFNAYDPELQEICRKFGMKDWEGTLAFVKPPPGVKVAEDAEWLLTPGAADMVLMQP